MGRENVLRHFEEKRFRFYASEVDLAGGFLIIVATVLFMESHFAELTTWKYYLVWSLFFYASQRAFSGITRLLFGKYIKEKS